MDTFDVIIAGGGPGGLSCARILAEAGMQVLLVERKKTIGPKVCAGGITWDGLIRRIPETLIERTFRSQHIFSNLQEIVFHKKNPIIATVNRTVLGQWMMDEAVKCGTQVREGWHLNAISGNTVRINDEAGRPHIFGFRHLVGADGSASQVRRHLGLQAAKVGLGINYQVPGRHEQMEWHLNTRYFGNGYGWIFPHRDSVSIGAYGSRGNTHPSHLKKQLIVWAKTRGYTLDKEKARAEVINFDYRGYHFNNVWLVGDAAGLASGLTGEGIHPAIVSGEAVAKKIIDPGYPADEIKKMVRKKERHERIVSISGRNRAGCTLLMETLVLGLRLKLIDFQQQLSM